MPTMKLLSRPRHDSLEAHALEIAHSALRSKRSNPNNSAERHTFSAPLKAVEVEQRKLIQRQKLDQILTEAPRLLDGEDDCYLEEEADCLKR
jgi:hypothetical protein